MGPAIGQTPERHSWFRRQCRSCLLGKVHDVARERSFDAAFVPPARPRSGQGNSKQAARVFGPEGRRPGSGSGALEPVRDVDGAVQEEDLGGGVRVDVVGAHEGLDVALGQALDDRHELLAHGVLEGAP